MNGDLGGRRATLVQALIPHGVDLESEGDSEVTLTSVTLAPGETSGWHCHPGPVVVTVESGALTYYEADGEPETIVAGRGFVEKGHGHIHMVRNEGTGPCSFYMLNVAPVGVPPRSEYEGPVRPV